MKEIYSHWFIKTLLIIIAGLLILWGWQTFSLWQMKRDCLEVKPINKTAYYCIN